VPSNVGTRVHRQIGVAIAENLLQLLSRNTPKSFEISEYCIISAENCLEAFLLISVYK
jgi:hypothetical protein